jgi:hypothetical protein
VAFGEWVWWGMVTRLVKMVYESALFRAPKTVIHELKIIPARHMARLEDYKIASSFIFVGNIQDNMNRFCSLLAI